MKKNLMKLLCAVLTISIVFSATMISTFASETDTTDPLKIVTYPNSTSVTVGDKAKFTIEVSGGTAPYTFTWQVKTDHGPGTGWTNAQGEIVNTENISSFTTIPTTLEMDRYMYRCVVTDSASKSITSMMPHAILTVTDSSIPFSISLQPTDKNITVENIAEFTVGVSGGTMPYSYVWEVKKDSVWTVVTENDGIVSVNSSSSSFTTKSSTSDMNGYQYRCVITDSLSSTPLISNEVTLTISQKSNSTSSVINIPIAPVTITTIKDPYVYENTTALTQTNNIITTSINDAVIYAKNSTIYIGDKFEFMKGITAKDDAGKGIDLTNKVTTSGKINTKKAGKYDITYKVTGTNGKVVSKTIVITVK